MMARAELAARSGGSALVRDMAKTLAGKGSSRGRDDREEFKLKTRKRDGRRNGGSLHGKFHRAQGGTVAVRPAPDGSHNVPTARVKPIQDGSRAMPWVDVPNIRPLADQRDGEKGLVASDLKIVRRNKQISICTYGANNFNLIQSIPVDGTLTPNDLVDSVGNGKRIIPVQVSTRNSSLHQDNKGAISRVGADNWFRRALKNPEKIRSDGGTQISPRQRIHVTKRAHRGVG